MVTYFLSKGIHESSQTPGDGIVEASELIIATYEPPPEKAIEVNTYLGLGDVALGGIAADSED